MSKFLELINKYIQKSDELRMDIENSKDYENLYYLSVDASLLIYILRDEYLSWED